MRRQLWVVVGMLAAAGACEGPAGQQDAGSAGDARAAGDAGGTENPDARPGADGSVAGDDAGPIADGGGLGGAACLVQYGTAEQDFGNGLVTDADGNAYIVGSTRGAFGPEPKPFSQADLFLSKVAADCQVQWTREIRTSPDDIGRAIVVDHASNLVLAGTTYGNFDGHENPYPSRGDVFVVKYDTAGNKLWSATWPTSADEYVFALAIDSDNRVYVTGTTDYDDVFVVQFDSAGNTGWDSSWGGNDIDIAQAITIDDQDRLYVTGLSRGDGGEDSDVFVLKLDTSGSELEQTFFGTAAGRDEGRGIAFDPTSDHLYLTGMAGAAMADQESAGDGDVFVVKMSRDLEVQWTRQFGTEAFDQGHSIACDGQGGVLVTGMLAGAFLPNDIDGDLFVARYSTAGVLDWLEQWTTTTEEWGNAIAATSEQVFVTGTTHGSLGENAAGKTDVVLLSLVP